jgi:D-alanine transaminase
MSRIAYVNGHYVPHSDAVISIDDRGYQFADGIYEVIAVLGGQMLDEERHLDRLDRSLTELRIDAPMGRRALRHVMRETLRRNGVRTGILYLQITRGVATRDHPFPKNVKPAIVMTARRIKGPSPEAVQDGIKVISVKDIRWQRRDIKAIALLPNVLAKQAAREKGAYEAWMIDAQGMVSEGSSTNAWIVTKEGVLVTHPADHQVLNGITRLAVIDAAVGQGLRVEERVFSLAEAKAAREAFLTSTTSHVLPIVQIDDQVIGNGHPGETTRAALKAYLNGYGLKSGSFR